MRNGIDMIVQIVRKMPVAGFAGHSHERNPRANATTE